VARNVTTKDCFFVLDLRHHRFVGASTLTATTADRSLLELPAAMAKCGDLEQLRALVVATIAPLLPVNDRVSIVFAEPDGEWLRIHRLLPAPENPTGALPRVRVEGTPVGTVVKEGVGRVVADTRADPNITFGHASHDGIRSTVSVPLKIGDRVIGAMNAGSKTVGACTEDMLRQLAEIASVVGPAFHAVEQALATKLIGCSTVFRGLLSSAQRTARSDADVLITGETGVGKTALSRALHDWSPRRSGPFVTVHLADLTPTLVESELFGYERGAFTGAHETRGGRFEIARGGTIFLDEISEAPLSIQTKLLRVIQDRCFERVGSGRTIEADVRIIAATSRDLRGAIKRGEFREDLFYRLSVVPLHVPALRDRREDLEPLVANILARMQRRVRLSPLGWSRLRAHTWPGNIRELESVLRRAAILEDTDELVLDCLVASEAQPTHPPEQLLTLDENERVYIEHVLHLYKGVIEGARGAARVLGVPPSTLRSKMKRLGIALRGKGRPS
jgi:transcriptional regulator with GAF, ATPase, and Fis domain